MGSCRDGEIEMGRWEDGELVVEMGRWAGVARKMGILR